MTTMRARGCPNPRRPRGGYTLVEVLIAVSLSTVVAAAVLSTVLMLGRSGVNLASYSDMSGEARRALDLFGREVRQAENLTWNSPTSITVRLPHAHVTYALHHDTRAGEWVFRRDDRPLIRSVDPASFRLTGYRVALAGGSEVTGESEPRPAAIDLTDLALAGRETKQLQLELQSARTTPWSPRVSNSVVSARFILRNKRVTS